MVTVSESFVDGQAQIFDFFGIGNNIVINHYWRRGKGREDLVNVTYFCIPTVKYKQVGGYPVMYVGDAIINIRDV